MRGHQPDNSQPAPNGPAHTRGLSRRTFITLAAGAAAAAVFLPGTTSRGLTSGGLRIVATTGILADLTRNVVGPDVHVSALVPEGADPHSFEPTPRAMRDIALADLAFSNYLMLEEQSIIRAIDANIGADATHIALAEEASGYGAEIIPLVESRSLDAVWLGLRVATANGAGTRRGDATRLGLVSAEGPGTVFAFVTGTFGRPEKVFDSSLPDNARENITNLPPGAHTHMSWAFTEPGIYTLSFRATPATSGALGNKPSGTLGNNSGGTLGGEARGAGADTASPDAADASGAVVSTLRIAVGVSPEDAIADMPAGVAGAGPRIVGKGHADITVDTAKRRLVLRVDEPQPEDIPLENTVIHVPPKALQPIPADPAFRFIGRPGTDVYQLPQAVLGKHVHGEIDPHLWHDVSNAQAYVEVIRDQVIKKDPRNASRYRGNASAYIARLDEVDDYVARSIASIPERNRNLVTTHEAYGYLANRYGLDVAGSVSPSPGQEPSLAERRRLAATLRDLNVPAVFIEQTAGGTAQSLRDAAQLAGVGVAPIWGDAFTPGVNTYELLMRANADSLARSLGGKPLGEHDAPGR
ncbi:metal ABC transporter solute-binding protein, Zn/Mn family [Arthrobacter sp. HMSC08H08]|uniref:metal ABC transporter solute-binding protein, Zn/Mn family n=1 Tax=Arthrobacter sp. HMSC08H08 TaxID=1581143 RepID=UPI0008C7ED5F|nr:zinc ABC transporter substrate-binding protein [Arthrobacter sp. HMSC08H08]OFT23245.1 hypothetical protein HMPREF3175_05735 [Arthrobacter sp. HMSC08H08]